MLVGYVISVITVHDMLYGLHSGQLEAAAAYASFLMVVASAKHIAIRYRLMRHFYTSVGCLHQAYLSTNAARMRAMIVALATRTNHSVRRRTAQTRCRIFHDLSVSCSIMRV